MSATRVTKEDLDDQELCLPIPDPTIQDRCDVKDCSAQAYVVTSILRTMPVMEEGASPVIAHLGDLFWCGHHYALVEEDLAKDGHLSFDYRDRLKKVTTYI